MNTVGALASISGEQSRERRERSRVLGPIDQIVGHGSENYTWIPSVSMR